MQKRFRQLILFTFDILAIHLAFFLAFYIRFEGQVFSGSALGYFSVYLQQALAITVIKLLIFVSFRMYNSLWRYASIEELIQVVMAGVFAGAGTVAYLHLMQVMLPRSILILTVMLDIILIGGIRFSYRSLRTVRDIRSLRGSSHNRRVLIVGAGEVGAQIIRELKTNESLHSTPIALIDDDHSKKGRLINGVPVIGGMDQLQLAITEKKIDRVILAMPSASRALVKEMVDLCAPLKVDLKIVPGVGEMIDGRVHFNAIRNVEIEDLLGRDPVKLDIESLSHEINGKRILVTGGGGSIGSEICRQIAKLGPAALMIVDIYENGAYDIEQELKRKYPELNLTVRIASVRERAVIFSVMGDFKPHIVYHAAAHKHVPLMEYAPTEAIKNNIFGTWNTMQAARKCGVEKYVQISTDKAVNPTNVMGATKRVCEMMAQLLNSRGGTEYVAVRFGNVLGSNGSVIPLFKRQIAAGGPVTVTHPDIIRYFMTIPEACSLVVQAGAIAKGGEIFILDMGEPVRIADLARNLIRLSGFDPDVDIAVEYTGLRPGEKLFEELLLNTETALSTRIEKIYIEKSVQKNAKELLFCLRTLKRALKHGDEAAVSALKRMVPEFISPEEHRSLQQGK